MSTRFRTANSMTFAHFASKCVCHEESRHAHDMPNRYVSYYKNLYFCLTNFYSKLFSIFSSLGFIPLISDTHNYILGEDIAF